MDLGGAGSRSNLYNKQLYKSDTDLLRCQQALTDNSRHNKLLREVRQRWHPDFGADLADLTQNHNALYRKRTAVAAVRSAEMVEKVGMQQKPPAEQLRELQCQLEPGHRRPKKKMGRDGDADEHRRSIFEVDLGFLKESQAFLSAALRASSNPNLAYSNTDPGGTLHTGSDTVSIVESPDGTHRGQPAAGDGDGMQRKPSLLSMYSAGSLVLPESPQMSRGPREFRGEVQMPQTLSLLLFRNADRSHSGETVLLRHWPVKKLSKLLAICAEACRPVISPIDALLNKDLRPVRSWREVTPGSVLLVKGMEALVDPPALFFGHPPQGPASLKQLDHARQSVAAEQEMLEQSVLSQSCSASTVLPPMAPPVGSPPWPSRGPVSRPRPGRKWQVDERLGMTLTWGGLGQFHRHHEFEKWQKVLDSRDRTIAGSSVPSS